MSNTEPDYRELVKQAYAGEILIGVDRPFARQLYTSVPMAIIRDETGESPYFERALISLAFYGAPFVLLASLVIAWFAFHWWAILVIPVAAMFWLVYGSLSVRGNAGILLISLMLVGAIVLSFISVFSNRFIPIFLANYFFALWCSRFVYCCGAFLLRCFVLRNHRALASLSNGLTIGGVEQIRDLTSRRNNGGGSR
jgi:hypothetical protein